MDLNKSFYRLLSSPSCSGAASGFLIGVLLQPLEIIKVCLIVNPTNLAVLNNANFAESFVNSARLIYQLEGVKGFWRGLTPALARIGIANSIYFHFLNIFRNKASNSNLNPRVNDLVSSSAARIISTFAINPLTILKTRMELPGKQFNYNGIGDAIAKIYKREGPKSFFKGAGACILRDVPFAGVYFPLMNMSKEVLAKVGIYSSANTMVSGMFAGLIATVLTHPFEVFRTHVQIDNGVNKKIKPEGIFEGICRIKRTEGVLGLYKGLQARLMRKPLSNALTFTFFEIFQRSNRKERKLF